MTTAPARPRNRAIESTKVQRSNRPPRAMTRIARVVLVGLMLSLSGAAALGLEKKPYDKQLLRLSELLGAVHYLRALCGANEGQLWRHRMQELMKAEGSSALRRLSLTRRFNFGYRSYSRTYSNCTPSAQTAISRFINEAALITDTLLRDIP